MENFVPNSIRQAGGLFALPNGIFILFPCNEYKDLKFINANPVALVTKNTSHFFNFQENKWPNEHCTDATYCTLHDGPGGVNFLDVDGSVTGYIGGWVISNNDFMTNSDCKFMDSW